MTKKIVHLVYSFGCGGLEKVIANLINHSKQYDVEHIIVSLTDDLSMLEQVNVGVETFVLNKKSGNDLSTHIKLFSLLKKLKPMVINTYNFGTIEYHLIAKVAGVPVRVHSDHGRGGDDPAGKNKVHNIFRKFMAYFITEYIVVSYDLYQWVVHKIKINNRKVSLLFNGVEISENIEYSNNKVKKFVTVGRLDKVKNQKLLINAFAKAVTTMEGFEHCILHIVGDGPLYNELSEQINSLEMNNSIYLLGFQSNIISILKNSDIFVLSSVYEAMPMTILEAMANKTPVICTDVGGISQFINEEQAWFIESNNCDALTSKLSEVMKDEHKRSDKVTQAYRLVDNNYSVEKMVQEYMKKYKCDG